MARSLRLALVVELGKIFAGLARMGYEKPSTKLTFYKAFFSTQWKFFIHTILHSLSAKRTSWNEFSSAMASALICLSSGDDIQEPATEEVANDIVPSTPTSSSPSSPVIPSSPPHQPPCPPEPQDAEAAQQLEIVKLKARVKKLEKINKVKSSKLRWLKKVGTSQRVESSDDVENVFNQGRKIVDMDQDEGIELVLSMQEDDTEVQEDVEVVTTAKLMTEVVTAAATQFVAASTPIPAAKPKTLTITAAPAVSTRRRKRVVIRDPKDELPFDTLAEIPKVKDKGKGILIEAPKPMKKKDQIEMDAKYARKLQ
nr:hypothetical protein [Tanacetum cinerariifolium]